MNKYAQKYTHVVHASEMERRDCYQGCVSRQQLRAKLREEAREEIDSKHKGRPGKAGESHAVRRAMAQAKGDRNYRLAKGLKEPR